MSLGVVVNRQLCSLMCCTELARQAEAADVGVGDDEPLQPLEGAAAGGERGGHGPSRPPGHRRVDAGGDAVVDEGVAASAARRR